MPEYGKIEELTESIKTYVSTSFELNKLEAAERSAVIGASVISGMVVAFVGFMFILFVSIGLSFYLSSLLGNSSAGFAIVGGFYFLLGFILFIGRKALMEIPIREGIIRKLFSKN